MKKIAAFFISVLLILSILAVPTFAATKPLTAEKYKEIKATADFVETYKYTSSLYWEMNLIGELQGVNSQYIYYDYYENSKEMATSYARYAMMPVDVMKDCFYSMLAAPKGFFENEILPSRVTSDTFEAATKDGKKVAVPNGYNVKKGVFGICDYAMGGPGSYDYAGYVDNKDGTYSFYYTEIDWRWDNVKEEDIEIKLDSGVAITLKPEKDGIALVSDKAVKKLPSKYSAIPYSITYKLDGGKNSSENPNTYTKATNTIKLKNPTRKGYAFKGWYSDKKLTKRVKEIKKGSTGNKTLYAKWSKNTYKITYKLNKGKNGKNPKTYTVTTSTIKLKNPTRKGYTFKGWYSDSKFKKKVTKIVKGSTGNKTLYAKWAKKK